MTVAGRYPGGTPMIARYRAMTSSRPTRNHSEPAPSTCFPPDPERPVESLFQGTAVRGCDLEDEAGLVGSPRADLRRYTRFNIACRRADLEPGGGTAVAVGVDPPGPPPTSSTSPTSRAARSSATNWSASSSAEGRAGGGPLRRRCSRTTPGTSSPCVTISSVKPREGGLAHRLRTAPTARGFAPHRHEPGDWPLAPSRHLAPEGAEPSRPAVG